MALLVILFILVPIAELYVIVRVGELIGVLPTLALLLAGALLGALLFASRGAAPGGASTRRSPNGRFPGREVADGLMIAAGATLLLIPGFITDIFGLILLVPPTRAIARRLMRAYLGRRFVVLGVADQTMRGREGWSSRAYDFDATAEEVEPDERQLRPLRSGSTAPESSCRNRARPSRPPKPGTQKAIAW